MPYQIVNQVRFHYELMGKETGQHPLVFIGGHTWDIDSWRPIAEGFVDKHQVLLFDNQGVGKTEDDGQPLTAEIMAANIKALMDSLGLVKPIIISFMMSAAIAQKLAYDYPAEVSQIIVVGGTMKFNPRAIEICEKLWQLREANKLDAYSDLIYDAGFGDEYKRGIDMNAFRDGFMPGIGRSQTINDQRRQVEVFKTFDSLPWAHKIRVPAVVITAEEDQFLLLSENEALANAINAKLFTIANSGHAVTYEQPEALKNILIQNILQEKTS
ncbi:MAG: alpha/beta hydrolase [Gammaproteobacteria bacterium]|nr:alpha/beta hydrolase [Gammaproteobacteria bacterium]